MFIYNGGRLFCFECFAGILIKVYFIGLKIRKSWHGYGKWWLNSTNIKAFNLFIQKVDISSAILTCMLTR